MDGTGKLFEAFVRLLPEVSETCIVSYPVDRHLSYEQLAETVVNIVPPSAPYVIIAESYSGPVAALVAARRIGDLRAVVFVASFLALPMGRSGRWIAKAMPAALFKWRPPARILQWLLMDPSASAELISDLQNAIASVRPEVLRQRLRDAGNADFGAVLQQYHGRIIYLFSRTDRLLGIRGLRGFLAADPRIETVEIEGPHLLLQCAPEKCLAALRSKRLFDEPVDESCYHKSRD